MHERHGRIGWLVFRKQSGMALVGAMVALAAGVAMLLFNALDPVAHKQKQSRQTAEALAEAKAALLGWAVSNSDIPGALPYPDGYRDTEFGFDGASDCPPIFTPPRDSHFLGRLPWKTQGGPCLGEPVGMMQVRDGAGEPLWYAVSQKLLRTGSNESQWVGPAVDWSDTDNQVPPWITVRDKYARVISDRVAAVVIAPGAALPEQDRSDEALDVLHALYEDGVGVGVATGFLDSVVIDGVLHSNADFDQDFIAYVDTESDPNSAPTFNDRLAYITVDELIPLLERRVLGEVEAALADYRQADWNSAGSYPWLSPFSNPNSSHFDGVVGCREGHLPIHLPGETFSTAFTIDWEIHDAELSPGGESETIPDEVLRQGRQLAVGECRWTDVVSVDCVGTAEEVLSEQVIRTYRFDVQYDGLVTVSPPDEFSPRTRKVTISGPLPVQNQAIVTVEDSVEAPGAATRTLTIDADTTGTIAVSGIQYDLDLNISELPGWFESNGWHRLVYVSYAPAYQPGMSGDCVPGQDCLTLTNALSTPGNNKKLLLVSAGVELSGPPLNQNRDTGSLNAYYESTNSVPGDGVFERHSLSPVFNDQVREVAGP